MATTKLSPEALEARKAYKRQWAKKNRDKCREYENRHWERVAAQKAEEKGGDVDDR